ncbi:MAG: hypothetical protein INQ03_23305 [Candidatus Heimdallarchaeota archaeon]|nr:hypothetical protein [Candidatus Heimdallarchaeota archaeon]
MTSNDDLFKGILSKMAEVAKRDGIITDDEQTVLNNVKIGLEEYFSTLEKAQEDGVIDDNDFGMLNGIAAKIVMETQNTALLDGLYSDDEKALVDKLSSLLIEYNQKFNQ